jgi:uncharacterized protein YgiM (DUF1202 family)
VRSGPGNQFDSLGKVSAGTTGQVIGQSADGKWYAVTVPTDVSANGVGWVNANYVIISPPGATIPIIQ